jgi:hypothetical protein
MAFDAWTQIKNCSLENLLKIKREVINIQSSNPEKFERLKLFAADLAECWKKAEVLGNHF